MPKIIRFHETGRADVLQIEDLPLEEPSEGEVRLKVEAIGLNRAEASMIFRPCWRITSWHKIGNARKYMAALRSVTRESTLQRVEFLLSCIDGTPWWRRVLRLRIGGLGHFFRTMLQLGPDERSGARTLASGVEPKESA